MYYFPFKASDVNYSIGTFDGNHKKKKKNKKPTIHEPKITLNTSVQEAT